MEFDPKRSIYLNDDINPHSSLELISGISKLHSADAEAMITLHITTTGGNVMDAFAVYEYVTKLLRPNLQTVVLGEASSMAIMIFLMGEKRYIGEMAVLRFHQFSYTPDRIFAITSRGAKRIARNLEISERKYVEIIVNKSGGKISKNGARALMSREATVMPAQAIELSLAHQIL